MTAFTCLAVFAVVVLVAEVVILVRDDIVKRKRKR